MSYARQPIAHRHIRLVGRLSPQLSSQSNIPPKPPGQHPPFSKRQGLTLSRTARPRHHPHCRRSALSSATHRSHQGEPSATTLARLARPPLSSPERSLRQAPHRTRLKLLRRHQPRHQPPPAGSPHRGLQRHARRPLCRRRSSPMNQISRATGSPPYARALPCWATS